MSYCIIPREGLDVARFGELRAELRSRLGRCESFRRGGVGAPTDHYSELGLLLNFDASDRLELVEVTPTAEVSIGDISLLGRKYRRVVDDLRGIGIMGAEDDSGIEFPEQCFALFNPAPDEVGSEVEGVTVFTPGYYG
ncbi:hypothetical protein [Streptomyces yangpuensis]|uniref:hypothetical protein n=1 Tax=Streptomyces yangpuensis TaxID=1648182 RepID=UPI0038041828